jgi:hypothetical protein
VQCSETHETHTDQIAKTTPLNAATPPPDQIHCDLIFHIEKGGQKPPFSAADTAAAT